MGFYWLYFSSQKWFGFEWVRPILIHAAQSHPISAMRILLAEFVIPNWQIITETHDSRSDDRDPTADWLPN